MGKYIARLTMICAVGAFALAPATGFAYSVPKPKPPPGKKQTGTTKTPTTSLGKQLQGKTGTQIANGLSVTVHFPSAGKIACTVTGGGKKIGSGSATAKKAGKKTLHVTFTAAGKTYVESHAGSKVTVKCVFTPKKGKTSTSVVSVTLG